MVSACVNGKVTLTRIQDLTRKDSRPSSSNSQKKKENRREIDGQDDIASVAFLVDGEHIVSGGKENKIRRWQVKDGKEVGKPMDAGNIVYSIATTQEWIVAGMKGGQVTAWATVDRGRDTKTIEFKGHGIAVNAVDISQDAMKIATGSDDMTVRIWSLSTGQQLLGPLKHDYCVVATKFSPDGRLVATATWQRDSIRIYDTQDGCRLFDFPVQVGCFNNQSLAWTGDKKHLFALSYDGAIHCLDVSTGTTLSNWAIWTGDDGPGCIALANNGMFIATSTKTSVSFWDTTTYQQIGSGIHHPNEVDCMAMSANYALVLGGHKKITLWDLSEVLPSSHFSRVGVSLSKPRCVKPRTYYKPPFCL